MIHRLSSLLALVMLTAGCGLMSGQGEPPPPRVAYSVPDTVTTPGAIYQTGRDVAYFEDLKARRAGDILTIRLVETTNASKSSSTETSKESTTSLGGPTLGGRPVTASGTPILDMSVDGQREFTGEGASNQSNSLVGSVTVTVIERLPNGNLLIEGEKWLTLNQGDELVRVSGIVRPYDIAPDNTVTSDKVAEARIRYSGRGQLANANRAGWLARFFNSSMWPY